MDISNILLIVLIYVVPVAVGFLLLFAVVRAAVLSALRAHQRERSAGAAPSAPIECVAPASAVAIGDPFVCNG